MGKTIRFNENGLIAIKKKLNEITAGIGDVSHNDVCENREIYTNEFKNWFGDWENVDKEDFWYDEGISKVVGENYIPKVVKHGTPNRFKTFDPNKIGTSTDPGWLGTGFYFYGNNDIYAGQYAGPNGVVMECYLNIRNPYIASGEDKEKLSEENSKEASDEFRYMLEDEGYDGVYYNADLDEEWVAFYPEQVRLVGSFGINESVDTDGVSHNDVYGNVKLYHGTDILALVTILKTNRVCASEGRQHGETHGMNWFSLKNDGSFNRGACFSIEVPENELNNVFQKMNSVHVISRESCLDISRYNPKVEYFCGHTRETLNNYYNIITKKGEKYPIEQIRDEIFYRWCEESGNEETYMSVGDYDFGIIMANILGEDAVRKEGFIDESAGKEFAPVATIGDGGNNPPVGGNHYGIEQENVDQEVSSSEVDLSSFKKRDTLPPGIWKNEETLDSRVRLKLLDIADDFWEYINLSWVEPKGIIITGSICNFNWSKFSDIDLHVIADFKEIDEKTEFVKQYVDSKKNEWNNEHEGLKIMGFPVELYVQDVDDDIEAGGIYDLEENAWIRKPNPHSIKSIGLNKFSIKDKAAEIMTIIDDMYDKLSTTTDCHEVNQIGEDAHYLWDKVKDLRKKSLNKNGESGSGNIVYKVLRRTGYLDRLFKLFSRVYDRSNSITESMKKYLTVLKEEVALDGSTEDNPYEKRWKAEREALKNFVANYGKLMQSREDNKGGKLYKVYFDETMSNLIGYNYCICVQWNEQEMKPGSTVYIRALDKFTPFIRRNLQFDTRGRDNMRGTYDDTGY